MEAIIVTSEADLRHLIREIIREELKNFAADTRNEPIQPDEALMTRLEMAEFLKISVVTLRDWVNRGLPCIRNGRRVLFQKSEVLEAIKGHQPRQARHKKRSGEIPVKSYRKE
ncbi:MAG: hypothetical protein BGO55_08880 [Sphingobacteriales bacterium 50-39]|nr:helix-turn-helix domain-containing protein [Sphingobacteriales bacterium]OJW59376.1 MAG: hypothetical protein BGO55_08880 [Sphingobacteriales bacterium 50-39]